MPLNNVLRRDWWDKRALDRSKRKKKGALHNLDLRQGQDIGRAEAFHIADFGNFVVAGAGGGIRPQEVQLNVAPLPGFLEDEPEGWDDPLDDLDVYEELHNDLEYEMALSKISVGADPEFFLKSGRRNISAHGIVPGNKKEPHKLDDGALQLDGTAVEFNIAPAKTSKKFEKNIRSVMKQVRTIVPKKYSFNFSPSIKYSKEYFKKIPEDCKELGCDPDFDAYTYGKPNDRPDNKTTMRTGAGHIHIGWDESNKSDPTDRNHILDCCLVVRNLDAIFSMIERNWDDDNDRRKMYGKLGAFRPKSYGVEYRSLSNAWMKYPKLWPFLFEVCKKTYDFTNRGKDLAKSFNLPGTLSPAQFNTYVKRLGLNGFPLFPENFKEEIFTGA